MMAFKLFCALLLSCFGLIAQESKDKIYVTFEIEEVLVVMPSGRTLWVPAGTITWKEYDIIVSVSKDARPSGSMKGSTGSYPISTKESIMLIALFDFLRDYIKESEEWFKRGGRYIGAREHAHKDSLLPACAN